MEISNKLLLFMWLPMLVMASGHHQYNHRQQQSHHNRHHQIIHHAHHNIHNNYQIYQPPTPIAAGSHEPSPSSAESAAAIEAAEFMLASNPMEESSGPGGPSSYHVVECVMPLYFLCQNNNCLPESHLCDGENDCGDNSDEDAKFCAQMKCNATSEIKCASGRCVPKASRCDRIAQCRDRSDELNCVYEPCPKGQFSCANHSQCLDMSEVCDGSIDCKDGLASDERHPDPCPANVTCPQSAFKCTGTNVCALPNWMCDGENDCGDNSDENEENCKNFKCPEDWFRCADNRCISMSSVCNGVIDCKDGYASDERHPDPCPRNVTCPNDFFSCEETNICAHPHWLCDGADDCGDKSDEDIEMCANTPCPDEWFRCQHSQRCIPPNWRCDGSDDCQKGEDELNCDHPEYISHNVFIPENNTLVSYVNYSRAESLPEHLQKSFRSATGPLTLQGSTAITNNQTRSTNQNSISSRLSQQQSPPPTTAINIPSKSKSSLSDEILEKN